MQNKYSVYTVHYNIVNYYCYSVFFLSIVSLLFAAIYSFIIGIFFIFAFS